MTTGHTAGLSRRRAWLVVLLGALAVAGCLGLVLGLQVAKSQARTGRRSAWLDRMEVELRQQIERGPTARAVSPPVDWLRDNHAVFNDGWVAWRVHSFHFDESGGEGGSGVGDLAILMDNEGRVFYSRSHFCDGTLPWALGQPDLMTSRQPANLDAFLSLFRGITWTTDRDAVESADPRS